MESALVFMLLLHSTSSMFSFCYAGAQFLACGSVASSVCVCAAMKKKIMVFEITKLKARYTKLKVQWAIDRAVVVVTCKGSLLPLLYI